MRMAKRPSGAMHVDKVVSRQADREYVSYLLRQSYRDGPQVKKRTLANLSALPVPVIEAIRRTLAGEVLVPAAEALTIEGTGPTATSPPHLAPRASWGWRRS